MSVAGSMLAHISVLAFYGKLAGVVDNIAAPRCLSYSIEGHKFES